MIAGDPDFVVTRSSARVLAATMRAPVQTFDWGDWRWSGSTAVVAGATLRRRTQIDRSVPLEWHCRGHYRALHIPGKAIRRHVWHPRLDVVLLSDALVVAGNGVLARFPIRDIVLVSFVRHSLGAVRIDLVDGDYLKIMIEAPGELVERLRAKIWDYEKAFLASDWSLDMRLEVEDRPPETARNDAFDRAARLAALRRRRLVMRGLD
jgi:hypothetical protein